MSKKPVGILYPFAIVGFTSPSEDSAFIISRHETEEEAHFVLKEMPNEDLPDGGVDIRDLRENNVLTFAPNKAKSVVSHLEDMLDAEQEADATIVRLTAERDAAVARVDLVIRHSDAVAGRNVELEQRVENAEAERDAAVARAETDRETCNTIVADVQRERDEARAEIERVDARFREMSAASKRHAADASAYQVRAAKLEMALIALIAVAREAHSRTLAGALRDADLALQANR